MKILIADDHPLVRDALSHALSRLDNTVESLQASDFNSALQSLDTTDGIDIVIVDLTMPGMDKFNGLRQVVAHAGDIPVVVFSSSEDDNDIQSAMCCGIKGYITKSTTNTILIASLRLVLSGGSCYPSKFMQQTDSDQDNASIDCPVLTRRQHEVVSLISSGKSNKEIAYDLGLSPGTVRTHIEAIFKALNVNNRTQASYVARELGLLK